MERRRLFLKWAGVAALCLAADAAGSVIMPRLLERREQPIPFPADGWLESELPGRPEFVTVPQGHKAYLRHLCIGHPILSECMGKAYTDLFFHTPSSPKIGDLFKKHTEYAQEALEKFGKVTDNPAMLAKQKAHIAAITLAATLSPYFTWREIKKFGVDIKVPKLWEKQEVKIIGLETEEEKPPFMENIIHLPHLLPQDLAQCQSKIDAVARCIGGDGAVHIAQHLFLAHQYLYTKRVPLKDYLAVPAVINFISNHMGDEQLRTSMFAEGAGFTWELVETWEHFFGDGNSDVNIAGIPTGFMDKFWVKDIAINTYGMLAGQFLANKNTGESDIDTIVDFLNWDKLYKKEESMQPVPQPVAVAPLPQQADIYALPLAV